MMKAKRGLLLGTESNVALKVINTSINAQELSSQAVAMLGDM